MVYFLVLINAFVFFLSQYGGVSTGALYLNHYKTAWYQLVTSTFCHASIQVIHALCRSSICADIDFCNHSILVGISSPYWFSVV